MAHATHIVQRGYTEMKISWIAVFVLLASGCSVNDKLEKPQTADGSVPIKNAGFEDDRLGPDNAPDSWHFNLKDWSGYRGGVVNPHEKMYAGGKAPEGTNMAFVSFDNSNVTQTLSEKLAPNRDYELKVLVGKRADADFQHYRVELFAGGTLLAADDNSLSIAKGEVKESVVRYTSRADDPAIGQALRINLVVVKGQQVNFDHVRLTSWPEGAGNSARSHANSVSDRQARPSGSTVSAVAISPDITHLGNISESGKNISDSYWHVRLVPVDPNMQIDPGVKALWSKGAYLHLRNDGQMGFNWNTPDSYGYESKNRWVATGNRLTIDFGDASYTFDLGPGGRTFSTLDNANGILKMTMQRNTQQK